MDIQYINDNMLSVLHWKARESERKRMNHDLRTSAEDRSQRMLNALEPGTVVPVHRHVDTDETVICLEGRLEEIIYQELPTMDVGGPGREVTELLRIELCPREGKYGVQIPKGVWHSINVIEPSTIFEAKDGAFVPAEPEVVMVV